MKKTSPIIPLFKQFIKETENGKRPAGTNYNNLAKYTASKLPGFRVRGWFGRVDYGKIYDTNATKTVSNPYNNTSGIGPAKSDVTAGSKSQGGNSEVKTYIRKKR